METEARSDGPPDPALLLLLARAATAPAHRRVDYREQVAAFGIAAIHALREWAAAGNSPGFACTVLEAIGRTSDADAARRAFRRMRADGLTCASTGLGPEQRSDRWRAWAVGPNGEKIQAEDAGPIAAPRWRASRDRCEGRGAGS
jgi:hypothetical protein